ncbi:fimbrial protein [Vibrio furnissii]|uniref:fimbrial protein n=1 Tax=Vibrio furnissii TaxID=29494 RepID=UPI001EEC89B5|nr:fimbrial protein [Vibrio furnissii]MCG6217592.1 fimbrial protein [Vibrio furnissii]
MFINRWMMPWIASALLALFSPNVLAGLTGDTCIPGSVPLIGRSPYVGHNSLDLSDAFTTTNKVSVTLTTNWSGSMFCTYGVTDYVYYQSPILGGGNKVFYITFYDENGLHSIKITTEVSKAYEGVNGVSGIHSLGYNVNYTLTFELLDYGLPIEAENNLITRTGSIDIAPVAASGESYSNEKAYSAWSNDAWGRTSWLAYQDLTVTYSPNHTTCTVLDQTVVLPETSIDAIRRGNASRRLFVLDFSCGGTTNGVASRNVTAWLYSADIVSTDPDVLRNSASTANDIGIVITDYRGNPIKLSNSQTSINDADILLDVEAGKVFDASETAYPFATYAIYGDNPTPGTVLATATVIIGYD